MKYTIGFTGITGMLGKNFLDYYFSNSELIEKYNIVGISRSEPDELIKRYGEKFKLIQYKKIDYFDKKSIENSLDSIDILIHAAGITKGSNYQEFERGNFEVTKNLLEIVEQKGSIKFFIFISSQSVLGPSDIYDSINHNAKYLSESDKPNPISSYGKSKLKAEELIKKSSVNWAIIRYPTIFGKYELDSLLLFKIANKRLIIDTAWDEFLLSYILAEDGIRLLIILVEKFINNDKDIINKIYHFSYDEPIKIKDFFVYLISITGKKPIIKLFIPKFIFKIAVTFFELRSFFSKKIIIINKEKIEEFLHSKWLISNHYTKNILGLDKIERNAKFEDIIEYYKKEGLI